MQTPTWKIHKLGHRLRLGRNLGKHGHEQCARQITIIPFVIIPFGSFDTFSMKVSGFRRVHFEKQFMVFEDIVECKLDKQIMLLSFQSLINRNRTHSTTNPLISYLNARWANSRRNMGYRGMFRNYTHIINIINLIIFNF